MCVKARGSEGDGDVDVDWRDWRALGWGLKARLGGGRAAAKLGYACRLRGLGRGRSHAYAVYMGHAGLPMSVFSSTAIGEESGQRIPARSIADEYTTGDTETLSKYQSMPAHTGFYSLRNCLKHRYRQADGGICFAHDRRYSIDSVRPPPA